MNYSTKLNVVTLHHSAYHSSIENLTLLMMGSFPIILYSFRNFCSLQLEILFALRKQLSQCLLGLPTIKDKSLGTKFALLAPLNERQMQIQLRPFNLDRSTHDRALPPLRSKKLFQYSLGCFTDTWPIVPPHVAEILNSQLIYTVKVLPQRVESVVSEL